MGRLFVLFIVSFAVQKLLSRSYLFISVSISIIQGDRSKKIEKDNCYRASTSEEGGMA